MLKNVKYLTLAEICPENIHTPPKILALFEQPPTPLFPQKFSAKQITHAKARYD